MAEHPGISVIFSPGIICVKKGLKIPGILGPGAKELLCACFHSHTKTQEHWHEDMYGHTHTYTHTPSPVLLPPACCWNCFPPSSEPGKAGFIVLTYLCVKSDCSVLYLCLYSDGETAEREWGSKEEGEPERVNGGGKKGKRRCLWCGRGGVHRSQASHRS